MYAHNDQTLISAAGTATSPTPAVIALDLAGSTQYGRVASVSRDNDVIMGHYGIRDPYLLLFDADVLGTLVHLPRQTDAECHDD